MKNILLILLLCCAWTVNAQTMIRGKIVSHENIPLPGVNIMIKGTTHGTTSDAEGNFAIEATPKDILIFSFIGYATIERNVDSQTHLDVQMQEDISTLGEVTIVSTGYESIPKERATGSFVKVNVELLNRRVGTDILGRLEDVTSGLIFNRNVEGKSSDISIRGVSTLYANTAPLIVIDNFPYDGDMNNINPNDVESITVLKDAAAASIWGARAGNGVIVITTKKGKQGQQPTVTFNSNVTIGQRPDLFYFPRMSTSDFIEVEKSAFARGAYEYIETSTNHAPLTPVVELLIANRDGLVSNEEMENQLAKYRQQDVRHDYEKYIYRKSVNQQYSINLKGGSTYNQYTLSAGFDKNLENLRANEYNRFTLNFNNTWHFINDKLELNTGIYYAQTQRQANNNGLTDIKYGPAGFMYPYARLKDDDGNNLPLIHNYRASFANAAEANGLLNWQYNPLDEIKRTDNRTDLNDYRINAALKYKVTSHLNAEVLYQYWTNKTRNRNYHSLESYYTRDLINRFTQVDIDGNVTTYPVPKAGILDKYDNNSISQNFRAQLNYGNTWRDHSVTTLGGYEVKDLTNDMQTNRYYGYDDELATTQPVDYLTWYPFYADPSLADRIPNNDYVGSTTDRFISYYANGAYTYKNRYTLSTSGRKDQSNLFGVSTNQRGVPLWSSGIVWTISEESFFNKSWVPYLKVRSTFGYNGNIDKSVTAFTTAYRIGNNSLTGLPYAVIGNPPNPQLRWERIKIWNTGVDFESKNQVLSGSIEYYNKWGMDLIGNTPFAPSTGIIDFRGNTSDTRSHGVDIVLNSTNIDRELKWHTNFLFSHLTEKVINYKAATPAASYVFYGSGNAGLVYPLEGKPLYAIYSFDWAGLDPLTGDPRGITEGAVSTDYGALTTVTSTKDIIYNGPARPTTFGSLRNTLTWKNISLSFNISYRLGYYFRRSSVSFANVLQGGLDHGDYANRWKNPGDEAHTIIPSLPEIGDPNRDLFFLNSSALVEKGDHIRFQDINLSYTLSKQGIAKLPVNRIQLYGYVNNLGILWSATKVNIDPDYPTMKPVRTVALGLKVEF
jgi:TonB-linked SusC/RagA family outer membrane protein